MNHDPPIAVETSNGKWRSEKAWPPADSHGLSIPLRPGSYTDDGQNEGTAEGGSPNGDGIWTFSPPLSRGAHFAGVPHVALDASAGAPDGNLVVDVYDVGPKGGAVLISRGAYLLDSGLNHVRYELYGDDWILHKRHRIGVLVTSSNAEWWAHVPTGQPISISHARITLEFLRCGRRRTIQGKESVKLQSYLGDSRFTVDPGTLAGATSKNFPIPPREHRCGNL